MPFTMEKMTNKLTPFVRHAWIFPCMEYQENISNGTRDTAKKVLGSPSRSFIYGNVR
jgi:hypothetical protein